MTTALFLLRCVELGISIVDLNYLTIGLVLDIWTEKGNDAFEAENPVTLATQDQMDAF